MLEAPLLLRRLQSQRVMSGNSMAMRFGMWAALVIRISSQDAPAAPAPAAPAPGGADSFAAQQAAAAFLTTMQCQVSLEAMINNEDWRFMNDTFSSWCRIRAENKMSTCCTNAEFAKGMADSCEKPCQADCVFTTMIDFCNAHFGKACTVIRKPFSGNNVSFEIAETYCIPTDCDNSEDLNNNLLIKYYDKRFRYDRASIWMKDYSDTKPLECPSSTVVIIVSVLLSVIAIIVSIPLAIFLFKAPKERGRVLRGVEEDEMHEHDDDTQVEAIADGE